MALCPRGFTHVFPRGVTPVFPPVCHKGVTPVCPRDLAPVCSRGFTPVCSLFGPTGRVCPEASYVGKGALMPRAEIWVLCGDDTFTTPHLRAGLLKCRLSEAKLPRT